MKYYIRLDGLRFIAVILVVISHWIPKDHFLNFLPNGVIGVTIFFVLSGFLISNILLGYKEKIKEKEISILEALKIFFIRRSLRIFPIYFLLIFFLYLYGYSTVREYFIYFVTYTTNILFFKEQSFMGTVSHLWTLAVEEQFYLVWPFVLFLVPHKKILKLIFILIVISIGSLYLFKLEYSMSRMLVFNSMDAFGMGALLAYVKRYKKHFLKKLMVPMLAVLFIMIFFNFGFYPLFSVQTFTSILTTLVLINLIGDEQKGLYSFLQWPPFVFIGKISYGIYLYHTFIPGYLDTFFNYFGRDRSNFNEILTFLIDFSVLILLSSISWYLIESPINNLKKRFSFKKTDELIQHVRTEI